MMFSTKGWPHTPTGGSAAVLLLVVGCAIGPSTTVNLPPPGSPRGATAVTTDSVRPFLDSLTAARAAEPAGPGPSRQPIRLDPQGDLAWLEVLRDTQLVALVRMAAANNRDVQAAIARVREYRAQAGAARLALFPALSANLAASKNQVIFGTFDPQNFDAVQLTADLNWELDFWGRVRRLSQAARFDYLGRDEDRRAAVLSLVSDVATAYLELRELDASVTIAEQTLASRRTTLELARQRFAQGVISELDVRLFESELAVPAVLLADLARLRGAKENQLRHLLGQEPGPVPRGLTLDAAVQAVAVPDSLPAELVLRRPDVVRAQRDWQAAAARVGVALGDRLPRFSLTGQYGTQRPDFTGLFESSAEIYTLRAGISIPLFPDGIPGHRHEAAQARAEQARAGYEQTVLGALREADDALAGLRFRRDQLAAQETQVLALRRALALAQQRYESGVSSYLEVLDAQRALLGAELGLVGGRRAYLGATVALYRALGGSWRD